MGHGDALHLTDNSTRQSATATMGLHENKKDGSTFREAATGKVIFQLPHSTDVGRCMAADIDPTQPGVEMWSARSEGIRNIKRGCGTQSEEAPDKHGCMVGRRFATGDARQECHQ